MKCWHCNSELIWGGDHDISEEDPSYEMVTNLSCPVCNAEVEVYVPKGALPVNVDKHAQNDKNV